MGREELIRSYLHGGRGRRRLLLAAMVRPTQSILSGYGGPAERMLKASELLSVLDRLDSVMGPDELREPVDVLAGGAFGTASVAGPEGEIPLTFDRWEVLRRAVEEAVSQDPGVLDLLPVAEVMGS